MLQYNQAPNRGAPNHQTKPAMKTTTTQTVDLAVTERVSLNNWKGSTRLEIVETLNTSIEISGIDTEELVLAVGYLLRNLVQDTERSATITRRLGDIANDLEVLTKVAA